MIWTEENIENFIIEHKDEFSRYDPSTYHSNHFLILLHNKFKNLVSIIPYLVKVFVVTIFIFTASIWAWNEYIRKDRHEVALKQKIENIITLIKK